MKRKGFTLIEMIAVIVIIGIFLLIAFPLISNAILTAQLKYFENQEHTLLISGRNYFTYDRGRLPKIIGEKKTVSLTKLLDEGYLKPIKDTKSNNCHFDDSYVTVTNINKGDYSYDVRLVCDEYDTLEVVSEWSDWTIERPTGYDIEIESAIFYNYQEQTLFYSAWSDWSDVVAIKDDTLRPISEVIGTESENRTLYRYHDQQWKWYKVDTQYSDCRSTSPGTGWVFNQTGSCQPVQESTSSCSLSSPGNGYTTDYQCADAPTPSGSGGCYWSTPSAVSGGTWSRSTSSCDHDHWYTCPSGYDLSGTTCTFYDSFDISTTKYYTCTATNSWSMSNCVGWCERPTPAGYTKTWYETGGDCTASGCRMGDTCSRSWDGTMTKSSTVAATQHTDYAYTYTWAPIHTYIWKHTISTGIYSYTGNIYYPSYSSTIPTGYPNQDINQTQFTPWTSWDINIPTSYSYRTIENKLQKRTRSVIRDWSGNVLPNYVMEAELVTKFGKSLAELSADPSIKLISQIMYRYRTRRI